MKKKSKIRIAIMASALAAIIVTGSINAQIVLGYEAFKNSVKDTIYADNATFDISMSVESEGKILGQEKSVLRIDKKNNRTHSTAYYNDSNTGTTRISQTYTDGNMTINEYNDGNGETAYNVYVNNHVLTSADSKNAMGIPDQVVDILELATDAFIGPAKDHFVNTDAGDSSLITGNFDRTQVPAIANAFTSLMFSQVNSSSNYMETNPSFKPDRDTFMGLVFYYGIEGGYINNVVLDSSVDERGIFDYVDVKLQLIGKANTGADIPINFSFTIKVSDKGTTAIAFPQINKGDKNVSWNDFTDRTDYYELNREVIDRYNEINGKIMDKMYRDTMTDEEKQKLLDVLDELEVNISDFVEEQ